MSKKKTFEEWVELYNKKVPEGFTRDERFILFYLPEKGFCEVAATNKLLMVFQACGDGRFWKKFAEDLARDLGLKVCGTICCRKEILAWIRLFGFKIDKSDIENGLKRYYCQDKVGNWLTVTEFVCENNNLWHRVTWGVS